MAFPGISLSYPVSELTEALFLAQSPPSAHAPLVPLPAARTSLLVLLCFTLFSLFLWIPPEWRRPEFPPQVPDPASQSCPNGLLRYLTAIAPPVTYGWSIWTRPQKEHNPGFFPCKSPLMQIIPPSRLPNSFTPIEDVSSLLSPYSRATHPTPGRPHHMT